MKTGFKIAFLALLSASGCTKETVSSTGNPVPRIAFVKIDPTDVKEFSDSLKITISYEDGDGDIGFENADINSLEIHDERLSKPDYYYVPPMAPLDAKINIKGNLTMKLKNVFLLGSGNTEVTSFTIKLKDRAGNVSNPVITPEITITR
jgi:hypothetical protein